MLSYNRRQFTLTALALFGLAGCGFSPVYAPGGGGAALLDAVRLDDPKTRADFLFVRSMEERLGRAAEDRYGLSYAITLREDAVAISANNVNTRYNIIGDVTYALRDLSTGAVVTSGKTRNFNGYSASGTTVATQAAQRDARARLMTILANDVTTRLTAALTPPAS